LVIFAALGEAGYHVRLDLAQKPLVGLVWIVPFFASLTIIPIKFIVPIATVAVLTRAITLWAYAMST